MLFIILNLFFILSTLSVYDTTHFYIVEELKTYADARQHCIDVYGTTLGRIRDSSYNQEITDYYTATANRNIYFGGNDIGSEGTWRWPDNDIFWIGNGANSGGSPQNGLYTNWFFVIQ